MKLSTNQVEEFEKQGVVLLREVFTNWVDVLRSGIDYDHCDEKLESMPDIESQRDDYDIRSWELLPGDALVTDEFPLVFPNSE